VNAENPERLGLELTLATIEDELKRAELDYANLRDRLYHLRQTAVGLRGVLGLPIEGELRRFAAMADRSRARTVSAGIDAARRTREARSTAEDSNSNAPLIDVPDDGGSSTDRVVELLRSNGRPVPRGFVVDQFYKRGWVEETWAEPEAAIRMAINRAVKRGDIEVLAGGMLAPRERDLFAAASEDEEG
jgi:hypothetical protein